MKIEQEILDKFGKILVGKCFDQILESFHLYRNLEEPKELDLKYTLFIQSLNEEDYKVLEELIQKQLETSLFLMMSIFEENEQFKVKYSEKGLEKSLVEISDGLMGEPIIDEGWINRFSKFRSFSKSDE